MNKKFLSAILFGALMVTSTGTFVSCKDYDDDIDRIDKELSGVKSQIAALESKINEGKWITSVSPSANGLSITMSDGQTYNITNGKDGADGVDGTEWTISDDGFWVCNGEKTDVKAVGKDGDKGETGAPGAAGQQEVKFEDGKWFLWNGTEFVEFKGAVAPTQKVPYYYTDPTDPNYTVLVVFDENGENEIRMPMTSGLGQIVVVKGSNLKVVYNTFNGAHFKDGKATDWKVGENAGKKALPKKGEYMLTANSDAFYVQVVPANYDISKLNFKLVNTKGDEAPIKLGTPEPCKEALSRSVSESGVYAIPFTLPEMTDAVLKEYDKNIYNKALSLVATESVRSTYTNSLEVSPAASNVFGQCLSQNAENLPYTVSFSNTTGYNVYDAFLTMANDQAKADSVKYGIKIEGMTVSATKEMPKNHGIQFTINQINSRAVVNSENKVMVKFNPTEAEKVKTIVLDAVAPHAPVALLKKNNENKPANKVAQSIVADFEPYFKVITPTEGDRLIWNENGTSLTPGKVVWTHVDDNGGVIDERVDDLVEKIVLLDKAGAADKNGSDVALKDFSKLRIQFTDNYGKEDIFGNGTLVVTINVYGKDAEGKTIVLQEVEVPFSFKAVEAAEIASWFNWNKKNSYTANGLVCYVGSGNMTLSLLDYFATSALYAETGTAIELHREIKKADDKDEWKPNMSIGYPASVTAGLTDDDDIYAAKDVVTWTYFTNPCWTADPTVAAAGTTSLADEYLNNVEITLGNLAAKYFGTYTISGIQVKAMNDRLFNAASLKVVLQGEASRADVISYSKALQIPSKQNEYIRLSNTAFAPNAGSFFGTFTLKDYLDRAYVLGSSTTITVYAADDKGNITNNTSTVIKAKVAEYTYTLGSDATKQANGIQFQYIGNEEYPAGKSFKVFLKISGDIQKDGNNYTEDIVVPATITIGGK